MSWNWILISVLIYFALSVQLVHVIEKHDNARGGRPLTKFEISIGVLFIIPIVIFSTVRSLIRGRT